MIHEGPPSQVAGAMLTMCRVTLVSEWSEILYGIKRHLFYKLIKRGYPQ